MQAAVVHAQVNGVHNIFDDLAKCQGNDGQIVAGQAQNGNTNDDAEDTGHSAAHNKGQDQRQPVRSHIIQADPDQRAGKRANAHKTGMTEAQLTQKADNEVQRNSHDHISADGHQLAGERVGQHTGGCQQLNDNVKPNDDAKGDKITFGAFFHLVPFC